MKNTIEYYYNFENVSLLKSGKETYIKHKNYMYIFSKITNQEETIEIYNITMNIDGIYKIILNKDNSIFTLYKNELYVLMRIPSKQNMNIKLGEIKLQNKNYKLDRSDWYDLWTKKNDYFEYQYKHLKKYNYEMLESLNYYIGMAENAISYIAQNISETKNIEEKKICHKRVEKENYLNPLFYIIDYRERELSEYLKYLFLSKKYLDTDIEAIIKNFRCSKEGYIRLFSRMLYPSFYFDQYELIINENASESKITEIIKRSTEYEVNLKEIYMIINKYASIKKVDWLWNFN